MSCARRWVRLATACLTLAAGEIVAQETPRFDEVFGILKSNLSEVSEADLNRAAVAGLLEQFRSQAVLVTNHAESAGGDATPLLARTNLFEESFAYLRIGRVEAGLAEALANTLGALRATNPVAGVVLDLRFANGTDYAEAARVVDQFVAAERPLMDWGSGRWQASRGTNDFDRPVAVLVNAATSGAAEALAGALRELDAGILIGTPTAGKASVFKEFKLSTGQQLLVATTAVRIGDNKVLPASGLSPDIQVAVSQAEEREYFEDPFKVIAGNARSRPGGPAANRPPRLTEADLVRLHRDLRDTDRTLPPARPSGANARPPQVTDPALARALDLLKALSVIQRKAGETP